MRLDAEHLLPAAAAHTLRLKLNYSHNATIEDGAFERIERLKKLSLVGNRLRSISAVPIAGAVNLDRSLRFTKLISLWLGGARCPRTPAR